MGTPDTTRDAPSATPADHVSSLELLTFDELTELTRAAERCGLYAEIHRRLLMLGMPPDVPAKMPCSDVPSHQIRLDMQFLMRASVANRPPLLSIWLLNAKAVSLPRPEAEVFSTLHDLVLARAEERLGSGQGGPAPCVRAISLEVLCDSTALRVSADSLRCDLIRLTQVDIGRLSIESVRPAQREDSQAILAARGPSASSWLSRVVRALRRRPATGDVPSTVLEVHLTLGGNLDEFDLAAWREAMRRAVGPPFRQVKILRVERGSVIITLTGTREEFIELFEAVLVLATGRGGQGLLDDLGIQAVQLDGTIAREPDGSGDAVVIPSVFRLSGPPELIGEMERTLLSPVNMTPIDSLVAVRSVTPVGASRWRLADRTPAPRVTDRRPIDASSGISEIILWGARDTESNLLRRWRDTLSQDVNKTYAHERRLLDEFETQWGSRETKDDARSALWHALVGHHATILNGPPTAYRAALQAAILASLHADDFVADQLARARQRLEYGRHADFVGHLAHAVEWRIVPPKEESSKKGRRGPGSRDDRGHAAGRRGRLRGITRRLEPMFRRMAETLLAALAHRAFERIKAWFRGDGSR